MDLLDFELALRGGVFLSVFVRSLYGSTGRLYGR